MEATTAMIMGRAILPAVLLGVMVYGVLCTVDSAKYRSGKTFIFCILSVFVVCVVAFNASLEVMGPLIGMVSIPGFVVGVALLLFSKAPKKEKEAPGTTDAIDNEKPSRGGGESQTPD